MNMENINQKNQCNQRGKISVISDLPKSYDPKQVEERIYKMWQEAGYFNPDKQPHTKKDAKSFCIVIPPPNVTGTLHIGHALNNTLQDILIRRARMKGLKTLWVPGIDHAGIATQNVVEKMLKKEGKTRHDLGREKFVKKVWEWKKKYGGIIIEQLKKLGCSCDWSRERFTMDNDYTKAVQFAFKHYFDKGLIYQGTRVINWCVRCQTSLSDLEVEHQPEKTQLFYFKYDRSFPMTIATTRPETKLGDTAVAINPSDKRYKKYIGKTYKVNFTGRDLKIKIIADKSIDAKFGTGALGVTPAHSLVDAELAEKYHLPQIKVIDEFGKMTKNAGITYQGLKVLEAREKLVKYLSSNKLLEKTEKITHNLSVCSRCHRPLEPLPSQQWFLKMKELTGSAVKVVEEGKIKFYPARWKKVYLLWMKNIRDWCISRQLWWGHQIPVWYKQESEIKNLKFKIKNYCDIYIGDNPPKGYKQVDDVLDTWFSSALWPFAVLGWPIACAQIKNLKLKIKNFYCTPKVGTDLDCFYPTDILSTARDILYLWVARMIFSSLEFTGKIPFKEVYIHPTVFNKEGKRMSKSLGTGVDPLDLMDKYGTDATRFGLAFQDTGTQDIKFSEEAILAGKKFANKVWNAARFIMMNLDNEKLKMKNEKPQPKTKNDKTILAKLDKLVKLVDVNLDNFRFGQAAHDLYDFFWHDFCDKYLEESKKQLNSKLYALSTKRILLHTLTLTLTLLHPIMPFVTEEIWQKLSVFSGQFSVKSIMISHWPKAS